MNETKQAMSDGGRLSLEYLPLRALKRFPGNARKHALDDLSRSMERFGYTAPILISASNVILAGHGRLTQLVADRDSGREPPKYVLVGDDGDWLVPCVRLHLDSEAECRAYVLADNGISAAGGFSNRALLELLEKADAEAGLIGTGHSTDQIERLRKALNRRVPDAGGEMGLGVDAFSVKRPGINARNAASWLTVRRWRAEAKREGLNALKQAKDDLSPSWLESGEPEIAELIERVAEPLVRSAIVVTAPASRDAQFKGTGHFASLLAARVAARLGLDYAAMFEPGSANRKGHHPRREKDPPKLVPGIEVPAGVLLIDDVATSGATLENHIAALRARAVPVMAVVWLYGSVAGDEE